MFRKNEHGRRLSIFWLALAIFVVLAGAPACYIPGILEPTEATDPPEGAVSGEPQILYGKFIVYQIDDGSLARISGGGIDYMVGDEVYFPSANDKNGSDYNILHQGNEPPPTLTFHYKDDIKDRFVSSGRPEAIVLTAGDPVTGKRKSALTLFYTDPHLKQTGFGDNMESAGDAGDTPATATDMVDANGVYKGAIDFKGDVDVYSFTLSGSTAVVVSIQGRLGQLRGLGNLASGDRHRLMLRILDAGGGEITRSHHGMDFIKYEDPDLAAVLAPGTYYIEVSDIKQPLEDPDSQNLYRLLIESSNSPDIGHIMKGEIQKARSCVMDGNTVIDGCGHQLQGGITFEPDNLSTVVEDIWPDCDGIPGTGDEGDAGIYEMCGALSDFGAGDGGMQYQEVDDRSHIEDGEYFIGKPTNVPAFVDTEATVIRTPDWGDTVSHNLSMFVGYNNGIYWLESLDGMTGLLWSDTTIRHDLPAVTPLTRRGGGNNRTPVVTSGILGFCDTVPAPGDIWGATALQEFAVWGGTTPTADGVMMNSPSGYPDTVAITFGGNGVLDSEALVDDQVGNTIYSGKDGIINTFFAPSYVAYSESTWILLFSGVSEPMIFPGNTFSTQGMNGPGNPDNPPIYSASASSYVFPLAGAPYNGDDARAFLLGDDEWNDAIFHGDTLNPAQYWRKQRCHFYSIGSNFDRCAMGVPQAPNGEEPVSILSRGNGRLKTIDVLLKKFRGDDTICHDGSTVAICPGPDGRFGWQDVYIPILGDDKLDLVTSPSGDTVVGISSGPDAILQTLIKDFYILVDIENWKGWTGGDVACTDNFGHAAICAGTAEFGFDARTGGSLPSGIKRLMTIWPMYTTADFPYPDYLPGRLLIKKDDYNAFDDEFCVINGGPAICPGQDGVFQSYPLSQRIVVDSDDDLFVLHDRIKGRLGEECYTLQSELYRDDYSEKDKTRFVFYHDLGIRKDDRVRWRADRGYYVSTGRNGINQSCTDEGDRKLIPMWGALPDQPIITPGADNIFQTYALKDEVFEWADDVKKISTGRDGVANSYIRGDDRLGIFMGTGQADQPCVRSGDGVADTLAQNYNYSGGATPIWTNDRQIYRLGEHTGFDAFQVFGPKAVAVNDKIYLYYSALGAEEYPESFRSSQGALGDLGECRRPGFDHRWGKRYPDYTLVKDKKERTVAYDLLLVEEQFQTLLDNNESIGLAPRIGVATSNLGRLRRDPTDWDIHAKPALDVGQQCAGSMSFPISLPLSLPGLSPDSNYYGAFSPEIELSTTPEGDRLFLMFYTGLSEGENDTATLNPKANVGLARSLNGIKYELVRSFKTVLTTKSFDIQSLIGGSSFEYGYPTIYLSGTDEYDQDMYGMFFNQFSNEYSSNNTTSLAVDFKSGDHIGWALRRGMSYLSGLSCSMTPESFDDGAERNRRIMQFVIFGVPVALVGVFSLSRRRRKS